MKLTDKLSKETIELMQRFNDDAVRRLNDDLYPIAPDLVEMLIDSIYGNIYQRGVLSIKEQHIATLSALIAMGSSERQLSFQGLAAYKLGITKEEIQEILIQNAIFSGFTRAMNAAVVLDEVYKKYLQGKDNEA
ncbi:carboxymuconolactone decarboxylase family protein [Moraxella catarrhalis]|uniref:Carboxymuconolactone decarboxylase family protein n=1 Tax=Moraxella catarrhalis TaxID=480 RepID=A0A3A9LDV9_MORCA|nr:carboxymuconolactone decarboxylase family protein [Moraxella catarrhalis]AZQ94129.1 carboxymuconolactone decarboxylase family protein [Moraxella catarrhalis]AZQ95317.1 carboxymuconolactone decarboxylase family protein [Moraxella catarrhalis]MPW66912.1 carboxymuconolactone decarboxylase family protein [Moraxella catarrhalis]MPW77147.1 carboxymuconolactone decarboxylase family protein [Moraxella catarrhalis]MPX55633.1 carboxymuconolactone decarboxylase family protein [Moraxella catarrhalis]